MITALITAGAFALMMVAMAVGVMMGKKPLKGSCGGAGDDCACEKAGRPGACATPDGLEVLGRGAAPGTTMQLRMGSRSAHS